jgi:glycosyltransferase involved in cell wall biosynthesis
MIYFNFLNAPSGGGLQNSVSFLLNLLEIEYDFRNTTCLVVKGSPLEALCVENNISYKSVRSGAFNKILFELTARSFIERDDVVFSIFGPPLLTTSNYSLNVGGMAISNVFYPEVDFWEHAGYIGSKLKNLKDFYRVWRYKKLDYWIFETELLAKKAIGDFGFPEERVSVVKMSPSKLVSPRNVTDVKSVLCGLEDRKIFILLCNAHPNKRHHLLPALAEKLKIRGVSKPLFVFTTANNEYYESVKKEILNREVEEYFMNIGNVKAEDVSTVLSKVDFVLNISQLESFSNNFVEAWVMGKPLVTTNDEWARGAAENAAIYLNIDNEINADDFIDVIDRDCSFFVAEGFSLLETYPSGEEKTKGYLDVIDKACKQMKITSLDRKRIKL